MSLLCTREMVEMAGNATAAIRQLAACQTAASAAPALPVPIMVLVGLLATRRPLLALILRPELQQPIARPLPAFFSQVSEGTALSPIIHNKFCLSLEQQTRLGLFVFRGESQCAG